MVRALARRLARALAALAWLGCAVAGAAGLSADEEAGRQIYLRGESPSGARITAQIGLGGLEVSGAAVACGNCHGEDGLGRAEGGIVPPNIQWSELVKPYGHDHDGRRRHGPFDDASLMRMLVQGVDPGGNRLDPAMPRFSMSSKDQASLVAYLKKLESQLDPGLSAESIRIGTLLPDHGRLAALGDSLRALLGAYFERLNSHGGIYGRKLELVVEPLPDDPARAQEHARTLLVDGRVFALLAPLAAGFESGLSEQARKLEVPVIGPLTLYPEGAHASNPYVFHLLPGIDELAQVLATYGRRDLKLGARPLALWHADTPDGRTRVQALESQLRAAGWAEPFAVPIAGRGAPHDALAARLKARDAAAVLVLGPGADLAALAAAGERIGWRPQLLVPGPLASRDILALPAAFRDRLTLAYPTSPGNQQAAAMQAFGQLLAGRVDARANQPSLLAAYGAGTLLVEGLKRTGRDLSRRKLVATLEAVQGFETGVLPTQNFNADRRIGSIGGYLVGLDADGKGLRPLGGYRTP